MRLFVVVPVKTDGRRSERLNSSVQSSMEFNRLELSKPWNANRTEDKLKDKKKQKNKKLDHPPGKKSSRSDRVKKEAITKVSSSPLDRSPEPTSAKSRSSCVQPVNVVSGDVVGGDSTKSSRREQTKTKDYKKFCCRPHQWHRAIGQASKKVTHEGLYEEFPKKRASTLDDLNHPNVISRDKHGLFLEEVDWKSTSIDWGDEELLTPNKLSYTNIRLRERNAKSMIEKRSSGQIHSLTIDDCNEQLSRSFIL
ncbi:hypothetical protein HJC23_002878 [Cyclotella cryptica]|uniref:Uncharacterized protein n=1 Tax=Cyclotella cryptica TaxID=29204 RepID=A0ABD3PJT5_9STRA